MNIEKVLLFLGLDKDYLVYRIYSNPISFGYLRALFSRGELKKFLDKNKELFDELQLRFPDECTRIRTQYVGDWGIGLSINLAEFPEVPNSLWDKWRANPSSRTLFRTPNLPDPQITNEERYLLDFILCAQHKLLYMDYLAWLSSRLLLIALFI